MTLDLEQIKQAPKALLHDHLDGGLRPATVLDIAGQLGYDTMAGMTVTQTGQVVVPGDGATAMDSYSLLAAAWNNETVRLASGHVAALRAFYPGSDVVRRCYGRGRKITPTM